MQQSALQKYLNGSICLSGVSVLDILQATETVNWYFKIWNLVLHK